MCLFVNKSNIIEKLQSLIKGLNNILLYGTEGKYVCLGDILLERLERSRTNNQHEVLSSTVKGIFSQREYFSKDIASENNVGYKIIRLHDVVLSPQNLWMGNINYNDRFDIGIVSPSYKVFSMILFWVAIRSSISCSNFATFVCSLVDGIAILIDLICSKFKPCLFPPA